MHRHASLNRARRLVFHRALGTCAVAPETARSACGGNCVAAGSSSRLQQVQLRVRPEVRLDRLAFALVTVLGLCAATSAAAELSPPAANALPTGGQVAAGSASLSTSGSTMTVGQASQRAIINWSSFDVGSAAAVNFVQPNAAAVALNRVTGGSASQIFGRLSANGQVYLVNPSGVLFGRSAQVDAGGLVASTLGISDADFLAGRDRFTQGAGEGASVVNQGRISVAPGGRIALLGTRVSNQGQLLAPGGDVALAAGRQVTLAAGADGHLQLGVDAGELATLVSNGGLVRVTLARAERPRDSIHHQESSCIAMPASTEPTDWSSIACRAPVPWRLRRPARAEQAVLSPAHPSACCMRVFIGGALPWCWGWACAGPWPLRQSPSRRRQLRCPWEARSLPAAPL
ncbi:hypothetical protein GCM10023165_48140 [Variovorax defluvii]|uniref:Filamentous haemagglutinin FhaB/tRNA nuclease CdiA-like TPS domain-containing protein n=1 Tax=Variovorax defluvii TaxID=913761 RepID=A0ABP8IC63_9BURK